MQLLPLIRRLSHASRRDVTLRRDAVGDVLGDVILAPGVGVPAGPGRLTADVVKAGVLALLEDAFPGKLRVPDLVVASAALNIVVVPAAALGQLVLGSTNTLVLLSCRLAKKGTSVSVLSSSSSSHERVNALTGHGRQGHRPPREESGGCIPGSCSSHRRT